MVPGKALTGLLKLYYLVALVLLGVLHAFVPSPGVTNLCVCDLCVCDCEVVIYSKKYISGLCPRVWHRAPEALGISKMKREIKVPFVTHNKQLSTMPEFMLMG